MDKNITRRAVLGTIVAGLAVGPFVIPMLLRQRQVELPSFLAYLRAKFYPRLHFLRTFDVEYHNAWVWTPMTTDGAYDSKKVHREALSRFYALPKDTRDTIVETQRRYWKNFSKIDEIEFDCTNFGYESDGKKRIGNDYFEGHVRLKYGYGLAIEGKDVEGKPIHWVFNMDGEISAIASTYNLSSMMLDFLGAQEALPSATLIYDRVYSVDAILPDNPYLKATGSDRYTVLSFDRYLQGITLPPHIEGKVFWKRYFNNRTGMLDFFHFQNFDRDSEGQSVIEWSRDENGKIVQKEGSRHLNPKFMDSAVPLPGNGGGSEYWKNEEIEQGIFLPTEYARFYSQTGSQADDIISHKSTYTNIRVKLV